MRLPLPPAAEVWGEGGALTLTVTLPRNLDNEVRPSCLRAHKKAVASRAGGNGAFFVTLELANGVAMNHRGCFVKEFLTCSAASRGAVADVMFNHRDTEPQR